MYIHSLTFCIIDVLLVVFKGFKLITSILKLNWIHFVSFNLTLGRLKYLASIKDFKKNILNE